MINWRKPCFKLGCLTEYEVLIGIIFNGKNLLKVRNRNFRMQSVLSNLDGVDLQIELLIERQIGVDPLPFVGMDSK